MPACRVSTLDVLDSEWARWRATEGVDPLSARLLEVLAGVPDPRSRRGRRYWLAALLAIGVLATASGMSGFAGFAIWARTAPKRCWQGWGFGSVRPSDKTFRRVFAQVDPVELERRLGRYYAAAVAAVVGDGVVAVAVDGKALRGARRMGAAGAHLVSALVHGLRLVIGQLAVDDRSNEIPAVFEASPCKAAPKGQTFIFYAAPLQFGLLHQPPLRVQDTTQILTISPAMLRVINDSAGRGGIMTGFVKKIVGVAAAFAGMNAAVGAITAPAHADVVTDEVWTRVAANCIGLSPNIADVPFNGSFNVVTRSSAPGRFFISAVGGGRSLWGYSTDATIAWQNLDNGSSGSLTVSYPHSTLLYTGGYQTPDIDIGPGRVRVTVTGVNRGLVTLPAPVCSGDVVV